MSEQPIGYGTPRLEGFRLESGPSTALAAPAAVTPGPVRVVLTGEGFMDRAMPLIITIGDQWVTRFQIAPDGRSITCFLDRMPDEGAVITVGYSVETRVELPERFSQTRGSGGGGV